MKKIVKRNIHGSVKKREIGVPNETPYVNESEEQIEDLALTINTEISPKIYDTEESKQVQSKRLRLKDIVKPGSSKNKTRKMLECDVCGNHIVLIE